MKSIINTEILSVNDYEHFAKNPYANSDFSVGRIVKEKDVLRNFAENLLLYDQVKIVTKSFSEAMILKNWLSAPLLEKLLREGVVKFIQIPFGWCYIQKWKKEQGYHNFFGIAAVSLANPLLNGSVPMGGIGSVNESEMWGWSSTDIEKAVIYTLTTFYSFNPKKIGKFARLIANNSIQLRSDEFRRFITNKTESDLKNPNILDNVNMNRKIDIENIPDNSSDIRKLFRILVANQNLAIMQNCIESDILTEKFYSSSLEIPLANELKNMKLSNNAKSLFKLEKLPVPETLGTTQEFSLSEIIKLRESSDGVKFREWIHKNLDSGEDVSAAYVELLQKRPPFLFRIVSTITESLLSLGITAATHVPSPITDLAVSGINEYGTNAFVERYITPNPPKIFLDKLKKIQKKS